MPLMLYNGGLLMVDGSLAASEDCCCFDCGVDITGIDDLTIVWSGEPGGPAQISFTITYTDPPAPPFVQLELEYFIDGVSAGVITFGHTVFGYVHAGETTNSPGFFDAEVYARARLCFICADNTTIACSPWTISNTIITPGP